MLPVGLQEVVQDRLHPIGWRSQGMSQQGLAGSHPVAAHRGFNGEQLAGFHPA
jgi:hypothetical protein